MDKYEGEEKRAPKRWEFERKISVVDIITIISALTAILYAFTTLDKRVSINENAISALVQINRGQDEAAIRSQARSDQRFDSIDRKLDRLLERSK